MATASVTNSFVSGNTIASAQVNTNFAELVSFLNNQTIHKDASVAFTAVPSGPATDPSSANHLVRKGYLDQARGAKNRAFSSRATNFSQSLATGTWSSSLALGGAVDLTAGHYYRGGFYLPNVYVSAASGFQILARMVVSAATATQVQAHFYQAVNGQGHHLACEWHWLQSSTAATQVWDVQVSHGSGSTQTVQVDVDTSGSANNIARAWIFDEGLV